MRQRLMAIIGVAFCAGALTALWAARPWEQAETGDAVFAERELGAPTEPPPVSSMGTYGKSDLSRKTRPPAGGPVPPLPDPSAAPGIAPGEGASAPSSLSSPGDADRGALPGLAGRVLIPVQGVEAGELQHTFREQRGTRQHEAIDILAPRGTPVLAAGTGEIVKLFDSERGGKTIYQFEPSGTYCYYYAHLDRYVDGLHEGRQVMGGQVIGYVGSTGNADEKTPHLHFAIFRLGPERRWWEGTPIDPYPVLTRR